MLSLLLLLVSAKATKQQLPVCKCGLNAVRGEEKFQKGSVNGQRMCQFPGGNCVKFFPGCVEKGATVCKLEIDYVDEMEEIGVGGPSECVDGNNVFCDGCLGRNGNCNNLDSTQCSLRSNIGAQWCSCGGCTSCLGPRGSCLSISYYECTLRYHNGARWCNDIPNNYDDFYLRELDEIGCRDNDAVTCTGCLGRAGNCNGNYYEACRDGFVEGSQWCGECMGNHGERCMGCRDGNWDCQDDMSFDQCDRLHNFGADWCGPTDSAGSSYRQAFRDSGCPNTADDSMISWWRTQTLDRVLADMTLHCTLTRDGQASALQRARCCGSANCDSLTCARLTELPGLSDSTVAKSLALKTEADDVFTTEDMLVYAFAALGLGSMLYGAVRFYCGKTAETSPIYESV